ncbi:putative metal-dependent enzyme [Desulfosporosinus acidiphilus SJ4]|uniref:Putative metal-dependent enzyme n=1 Tax=Desulfosporosinus acidiphilus (strain DSM 22704 / JCM 16185 / SJ4) TaxID=646529 RepID=I4D7M1_DESAJ|nr:putative metal-dependent enzyme [Desulfosporosinus acidiphilus SJ4]
MAVLGGRAHLNGITFATNKFVVRGKLKNGDVRIHIRKLPENRLLEVMDRIPFIRGISKLAKLNGKLFLVIILLLAIPWEWFFSSNSADAAVSLWSVIAIYGTVLIVLVFLFKELWQYHGAEHKAFNVYSSGGLLEAEQVQAADRVSSRCGTNLVVIMLPIVFLLSNVLIQIPLLLYLVSMSLSYEIFDWSYRRKRLSIIFKIAAILQKYIVTKEPNEDQLRLAIKTLSKAIELDRVK